MTLLSPTLTPAIGFPATVPRDVDGYSGWAAKLPENVTAVAGVDREALRVVDEPGRRAEEAEPHGVGAGRVVCLGRAGRDRLEPGRIARSRASAGPTGSGASGSGRPAQPPPATVASATARIARAALAIVASIARSSHAFVNLPAYRRLSRAGRQLALAVVAPLRERGGRHA